MGKKRGLSPIGQRVTKTYRYYLTKVGRAAVAACFHIKEFIIIPALAQADI